jgi:hypothetical protein
MPLTLAPDAITFADLTTLSPTTIKWAHISASTNLISNNRYLTNTSSIAFTVTLPPLPQNGDFIVLADGFGTWHLRNVTVNRNGKLINGLSEDLICDVNSGKVELIYNTVTNSWRTSVY